MDPELEKLVSAGKLPSEIAKKIASLAPGTCCEHKSWGVGVVKSWDLIGGQMEIDFEDRSGHSMKLEFAANSLTPLPEDHILAQRAGNVGELSRLAADDPVDLVGRVLASFGGTIHLDGLERVLMGTVVPEGEYKSWWDATKRKLRKDKAFVVPSRRSDPLERRAENITPAQAILADFSGARDLKDKARAASVILEHIQEFENPAEELKPVIEDISSSVSKALKMHPLRVVELIAVRDDLVALVPGLEAVAKGGLKLGDLVQAERHQLGHILTALPVARLRLLLSAFPEAFGDDWAAEALAELNRVGSRGVTEITRHLIEQNQGAALIEYLKRGVRHRDLSLDVLVWICRERKGASAELIDDELPVAIMGALERHHMDDDSKKGNRLHDILLDDRTLLGDLVREMDLNHVRNFVRRLLMTPVFEELNRRSLLARIIKVHGEVQELVSGEGDAAQKKDESIVVSWESLEQRKKDLEELIQRKIPENTKEIAVAREYGDLRENFEFKAAKQQQAVLLRKKSDWERELEMARGTDFKDADPSTVTVGTVVSLEDLNGGERLTYTLLGAWDSDPGRNIVAYLSELGKSLIGKAPGEEVDLPGAEEGSDSRRMKIVEIRKYAV